MISSAALAFFYLSGLYKGKFGVRVTAIYIAIFLYDYIGFCFHLSPWILLMLLGEVASSSRKHFRYFGRGVFFICSLFDCLEFTFMGEAYTARVIVDAYFFRDTFIAAFG